MSEAIALLSSTQWSERRDGLEHIRRMMQGPRPFTRSEIKRICEIFSRLFNDPHTKVFSIFLDTLNMFINTYRENLSDWLFTLLTRLLVKQGSENLSTVNKKLCTCLDTVLVFFPSDLQFKTLINFVKDSSMQAANHKVKIAVFYYMQALMCRMNASDVRLTEDLKFAVCRIVALTAEPKSQDLRRAATVVLVALFNLNSGEMNSLLSSMPQDCYDAATKIIKAHLHMTHADGKSPSSSVAKQFGTFTNVEYESKVSYLNTYVNNLNTSNMGDDASDSACGGSGAQFSHVVKDIQNLNLNANYQFLSANAKHLHRGMKNDEILSKDSGVQSNGDLDSGKSFSIFNCFLTIMNLFSLIFVFLMHHPTWWGWSKLQVLCKDSLHLLLRNMDPLLAVN
jgi:CLIP-associating protein 1/2